MFRQNSFFIISLTFFLLKKIVRLVHRYIRDKAFVEYPLHSHQYGYQTGRLVEMAVLFIILREHSKMGLLLWELFCTLRVHLTPPSLVHVQGS